MLKGALKLLLRQNLTHCVDRMCSVPNEEFIFYETLKSKKGELIMLFIQTILVVMWFIFCFWCFNKFERWLLRMMNEYEWVNTVVTVIGILCLVSLTKGFICSVLKDRK